MNEFIKKLIEQLNENAFDMSLENPDCKAVWIDRAISIVNQLAEEYRKCSKPTCKDCEVYDKEKHYCPKWCELIKRTTEELAEEYNNDVCEWKYHVAPSRNTYYLTDCGHRYNGLLYGNGPYCGFCGKKIKK